MMTDRREYKKIVKVSFFLRANNDSLSLVLQHNDTKYDLPRMILYRGEKCNQSHSTIDKVKMVDRDDLECWHMEFYNVHIPDRSEWVNIEDLSEYDLPFDILKDIFSLILDEYQYIKSRTHRRLNDKKYFFELYKKHLYREVKRKYQNDIREMINQPEYDNDLLRQEIETLSHFHPSELYPCDSPFFSEGTKYNTEFQYIYTVDYTSFKAKITNN